MFTMWKRHDLPTQLIASIVEAFPQVVLRVVRVPGSVTCMASSSACACPVQGPHAPCQAARQQSLGSRSTRPGLAGHSASQRASVTRPHAMALPHASSHNKRRSRHIPLSLNKLEFCWDGCVTSDRPGSHPVRGRG
jgi:hypothetical protein